MVGEPKPITHPVKFWENGNRPLEIVTSWQWFIKYPPTDELLARGQRAALVPGLHAGPLRELGQRPRRRLEHHAPALLRRALPGLVPGARRRLCRSLPTDRPERRSLARRPVDRRPRRLRRVAARPAGRLRRRPRRDGHVGDVVGLAAHRRRVGSTTPICSSASSRWTCGRRPTRSSARGSSTASCARRSCTAACRGTTPRSRGSCTTPIARSCRSRRATATTTRTTCSTRSAPTRSGTGRATAVPDRTSPSTRTR